MRKAKQERRKLPRNTLSLRREIAGIGKAVFSAKCGNRHQSSGNTKNFSYGQEKNPLRIW
jgi:hypothetical protein